MDHKPLHTFDKKHRWALVFMAIIVVMRLMIPYWFTPDLPPSALMNSESQNPILDASTHKVGKITTKHHKLEKKSKKSVNNPRKPNLHSVDPNTASIDDLLSIGLPKKTAFTLRKFRNKGARFETDNDLLKVYGMTEEIMKEIKPFLNLKSKIKTSKNKVEHKKSKYKETINKEKEDSTVTRQYKKTQPFYVEDINTASYEELKKLKGIGHTFAGRIVKYRDKLGGFVSLDQLHQVYGLQDSTIRSIEPFISIDTSKIHKIKINSVTFKALLKHPSFNYEQVKLIFNYKRQHGSYSSIKGLVTSLAFDEQTVKAVKPYIEFD